MFGKVPERVTLNSSSSEELASSCTEDSEPDPEERWRPGAPATLPLLRTSHQQPHLPPQGRAFPIPGTAQAGPPPLSSAAPLGACPFPGRTPWTPTCPLHSHPGQVTAASVSPSVAAHLPVFSGVDMGGHVQARRVGPGLGEAGGLGLLGLAGPRAFWGNGRGPGSLLPRSTRSLGGVTEPRLCALASCGNQQGPPNDPNRLFTGQVLPNGVSHYPCSGQRPGGRPRAGQPDS